MRIVVKIASVGVQSGLNVRNCLGQVSFQDSEVCSNTALLPCLPAFCLAEPEVGRGALLKQIKSKSCRASVKIDTCEDYFDRISEPIEDESEEWTKAVHR